MKSVRCLALFLSAALAGGTLWAQEKVSFVNPIIGTNGMGHTFPGACVPFGLVQLSPDTDTIPHNVDGKYQPRSYEYCAGYQHKDSSIVGFQSYAFQRNRSFRPGGHTDHAGHRLPETESRNSDRSGRRLPLPFLARHGDIPSRLLRSHVVRLWRKSATDDHQTGGSS